MNSKTVLVVDDDQAIRVMLKRLFSLEGYRVQLAADFSEALERAESHKMDLALVDYDLPGENGCEVVRELKRLHPRMQTMLITGNADGRLKEQAQSLGASYLQKPLDLPELLEWTRL